MQVSVVARLVGNCGTLFNSFNYYNLRVKNTCPSSVQAEQNRGHDRFKSDRKKLKA